MLGLAETYLQGEHKMKVIMWRFLNLYPKEKAYSMVMERHKDGVDRPTEAVCGGNRTMMAVTCEGNAAPCLQISDLIGKYGYRFDNLKERRLTDILQGGQWIESVCANLYALRENNKICDSCEWFGRCAGGCRGLGVVESTRKTGKMDYFGCDPMACLFFKGGWYGRVQERLSDYKRMD